MAKGLEFKKEFEELMKKYEAELNILQVPSYTEIEVLFRGANESIVLECFINYD